MDFLDLYYRAFKSLNESSLSLKSNEKVISAIKNANTYNDVITTKRTKCIIEKDWIEAIEKGLPYISRAIGEQRQFIANEGNVIPIEMVKRVSKASTVHLARHSELITKLPKSEEDPLIPDRLFMEEKLSDFAVYENKFLFYLLSYLRDFVNVRSEKIDELGRAFFSDFRLNKNIRLSKRTILCEIKFHEENMDFSDIVSDDETRDLINRIEDIQHIITSLLSCELMQNLAKVSMIKPPIVKTNVLKMDVNFKNAVELYEFISEYGKDGYQIKEMVNNVNPFCDELSLTSANIVNAISFMSYTYGGLEVAVKERFKKEEVRLLKDREDSERAEIERLKAKIDKSGKDLETYILLLEKRNEKLQNDSDLLKKSVETEKLLRENLAQLKAHDEVLKSNIEKIKSENIGLRTSIEEEKANYAKKIEFLNIEYEDKLARQEQEFVDKFSAMENELHEENSKLNDEKLLLGARLKSVCIKNGEVLNEDINYTSKEHFLQLEKEYEVFTKFFEGKWKSVKKQIRVSYLGKKLIGGQWRKGENEKDEQEKK